MPENTATKFESGKTYTLDDLFGPEQTGKPVEKFQSGKTYSLDDLFGPESTPTPTAPPSLLDSFKEGLKQGAFYKGYLAPDSNYVAPPTPEEQAYFQQHRTLPPPAAPPAPFCRHPSNLPCCTG